MYGKDYAYANTRLADTVVRLEVDGTPIWVHVVHDDGKVVYQLLEGGDDKFCHLDDIDTCPVPLGYVNTTKGCHFLERMPVRRYRQGLRRDNMILKNGLNAGVLAWKDIAKTIVGTFPTFKAAMETAKKIISPVAWHRHWAIDGNGQLHYKGNVVGVMQGRAQVLGKKYQYLKEALEVVT